MKRAWWIIVCLLGLVTGGASAQSDAPLIITLNGDLWAWYGDTNTPPISVTQWGYNEPGVLSPDGTRVAYSSVASLVVEAFARGVGAATGVLPSNIWVVDPRSGSGVRVGDQPANASFGVEGVPDSGVVRSDPAWSPDGSRLVWAEQTYPTPVDAIVVYDFSSGARAIVDNLPPALGVQGPKEVLWGQAGIVVRDVQPRPDGSIGDMFTVYAPDGTPVTSFAVGAGGRAMVYYALMQSNGREVLGVLFNDGVWELFDPSSGGSAVADGFPELYSTRAGNSSLALSPVINDAGSFTWRVLSPDGAPLTQFISAPYFVPHRYAISPDGQAVAYSDFLDAQNIFADTLNVWQNGTVTVMPNPTSLPLIGAVEWGPVGWRVRPGVG